LIKRTPGFSGKIFWSLEIPFKTGFTVLLLFLYKIKMINNEANANYRRKAPQTAVHIFPPAPAR